MLTFALAVQMFHQWLKWFFACVPYLVSIGTILLGLFEIIKDRDDYKKVRLSRPVAIIFVVVGVLQIVSLRRDAREKGDAENNIRDLAGQVKAANKAQSDNTALYLDTFGKMSDKLTTLEVEVKTDALQKKIVGLQAELQNTEKALAPGPKASLTFTFAPFHNSPEGIAPITDVTLPKQPDGAIHFEFSVLNNTDVDASDVGLNLGICDSCKFAKETPELSKLPGLQENRRFLSIPMLHAREAYKVLGVDFLPPPTTSSSGSTIEVGFEYRCHTCVLDRKASRGTIRVQ
jgi:hypothetical protein